MLTVTVYRPSSLQASNIVLFSIKIVSGNLKPIKLINGETQQPELLRKHLVPVHGVTAPARRPTAALNHCLQQQQARVEQVYNVIVHQLLVSLS